MCPFAYPEAERSEAEGGLFAYMKTFIIPTSSIKHLAEKIKKKRGNFTVIFPEKNKRGKRYFPEGEVYIKIPKLENLKQKRLVVLHSGIPRPNDGLIELEIILQILNENQIKPEVFFTYFPYGRQDKIFEKGEGNLAENLIKKLTDYYKVKKIYLIDSHFEGRKWVKKYPIINVSAVQLLLKKAEKEFSPNILFISPDKGGERRTGIFGLEKQRIKSSRIRMFSPDIPLKGKIVGVVDDMITTGGTLLKFYEIAKKSGAKKIIALITHGVFPSGISKIKKKYSKLYLTNTIKQKQANVDITDLIIKTLT